MEARFFKKTILKPAQQIYKMAELYPRFKASWDKGRVIWTGEIQPIPISEIYEIEIFYKLGGSPKVQVLNPQLKCHLSGAPIPHVYAGNYLCLYLPKLWEWHAGLFIANTIVPWISLWLYFYEIWLATGEWRGGGVHPNVSRKKRK